jgi:phospholipid transport system substrate-binding protein
MNRKVLYLLVALLVILLGSRTVCFAGEPTQQLKQTTDKILSILSDPDLKDSAKAQDRKQLISRAIDERFDWEEMSRRSLARHWAQRTPEEKKEFMQVYRQLLERTYLDKVEDYSGETVSYEGESVEGTYANVKVKILTTTQREIPIEYRVMKKGSHWLVYDISIEGVSLVNNYRSQFNSILVKSSYKELIRKLKEKISSPEKK